MMLEILSPAKTIYTGEVTLVQLPGSRSSFEVLKNHAPIISTLKKGTIRIVESGGQEKTFSVTGGVVENRNNRVIILVDGK
ncbi:MAG: ATP synthase F1 subunit epsilon [Prolixibacteraceae bacterium]|jgi:F-type H+-transporting ATPase subunit epsilon|nr:ATP synthase F1 subunit epsilon [Prolixibacteraceae bacterium]HOY51788.1 ATP synthase F1 subunit epsilon [Prolixibacteraceae bacterium]